MLAKYTADLIWNIHLWPHGCKIYSLRGYIGDVTLSLTLQVSVYGCFAVWRFFWRKPCMKKKHSVWQIGFKLKELCHSMAVSHIRLLYSVILMQQYFQLIWTLKVIVQTLTDLKVDHPNKVVSPVYFCFSRRCLEDCNSWLVLLVMFSWEKIRYKRSYSQG